MKTPDLTIMIRMTPADAFTPDRAHESVTVFATDSAKTPSIDGCGLLPADSYTVASATDLADVVVLGDDSRAADVLDARRRLEARENRTWLVCQGSLPAKGDGRVSLVHGREKPRIAVSHAVYFALVDRQYQHLTADTPTDDWDQSVFENVRNDLVEGYSSSDYVSLYKAL